MPYNLLLLPLLGGFIFIRQWNVTRYYAERSENQRLLLYSAVAGVALLGSALVLSSLAQQSLPGLAAWWHNHVEFAYSGPAALSFLLGAFLWIPLNWLSSRQSQIARIVEQDGDRIELLLMKAMRQEKMISLTLKSGKTYFGRVSASLNPALKIKSMSVFPYRSGYRDERHNLRFTTEYWKIYTKILDDLDKLKHQLDQEKLERKLQRRQPAASVPGEEKVEPAEQEKESAGNAAHIRKLKADIEKLEADLDDYETTIFLDEISILSIYRDDLYHKHFAPKISNLSPSSGSVGQSIKLSGTNLDGVIGIQLGGINVTTFTINSATEVTVIVPEGAASGLFLLTTLGGSCPSPTIFTVFPKPTISGFIPKKSPAGSTIRVVGTNLSEVTALLFNGVEASFVVQSPTEVEATVPAGQASGPISIKTPGGTSISLSDFELTV
jgi:hypothetical protein